MTTLILRAVTAALLLATNAWSTPTLIVEDGILRGAIGVEVDGALYDVSFVDGTCIGLFDGCDDSGDFMFTDSAVATTASEALLAHVLVDGPQGQFDRQPILTAGCGNPISCGIFTPYQPTSINSVSSMVAINSENEFLDDVDFVSRNRTADSLGQSGVTWAFWTPTSATGDSDNDGVPDIADNCLDVANSDQRDTDSDGVGNICDPDVAAPNDCMVNFADFEIYRQNLFVAGDLDTDNNGDGRTNFADLELVRGLFFGPPGPSAKGCACGVQYQGFDSSAAFGAPLFARGAFNDWGDMPEYQFVNNGDGTYTTEFEMSAGAYDYRLALADWSVIYSNASVSVTVGVPTPLTTTDLGPSIVEIPEDGCYTWTVTVIDNATVPAPLLELLVTPFP